MINDSNYSNKEQQKEKIRERYKGVDQNLLEVIPAAKKEDIFHPQTVMNVAVYARVSTDSLNQTSSYELQKNYYDDMVSRRPDWNLVEIYADEGISGTSLKHRDSFKRMIEDCKSGKIDLIITKSVSRFARNIMDCIGYVRELKSLKHPVGVFFETENLYTLKEDSEMALSFTATMAQEESHIKSNIMNASIDMRFSRGIFLTPVLLGYDQDENGDLIINEDEAKTVRLIFFMYLYGYSITEIANTLSSLGCETKRGNIEWSYSSVLQILQNERHCGDIVARKTFTPNYLDHKSRKNIDEKRKVIQRDHHVAIISRDDWLAVQRKLANQRYGNTSYLPVLHVIKEGFLTGFIPINPRWAGFSKEDYLQAAESVQKTDNPRTSLKNKPSQPSTLQGYEVVRGQFFGTNRIYVTISNSSLMFSMPCIEIMNNTHFIELLINPIKKIIIVRASKREERNAIEWSRSNGLKDIGKKINGAAFLPSLYEIFSWEKDDTYRVVGTVQKEGQEQVLLFDINDATLMIPKEMVSDHEHLIDSFDVIRNKNIVAFPENWLNSFGIYYAQHSSSQSGSTKKKKNLQSKGEPVQKIDLEITSEENVKQEIDDLIEELKADGQHRRTEA